MNGDFETPYAPHYQPVVQQQFPMEPGDMPTLGHPVLPHQTDANNPDAVAYANRRLHQMVLAHILGAIPSGDPTAAWRALSAHVGPAAGFQQRTVGPAPAPQVVSENGGGTQQAVAALLALLGSRHASPFPGRG